MAVPVQWDEINSVPITMPALATSIAALLSAGSAMAAPAPSAHSRKRQALRPRAPARVARGLFDLGLTAQPLEPNEAPAQPARTLIHKQFRGDLEASGMGQMLSFRSATPGSAGYVAMERVEGRLAGRSGSFVLMHLGEMTRGAPQLSVRVVPDSGTGELAGLSGDMSIEARNGQHLYVFTYRLPGE